MEYITRKSLLYKTEVEYGDYTINHVQGCSHGCNYPCYAMMMSKRFGRIKNYEEWCSPKIVSNALELLDKEIPKYKAKIKSVHLCFTTDPFMYGYNEISDLSISIIKKLNDNGIKCSALTKGIYPEKIKLLDRNNNFGITLVSLDENFRHKYEPGAAPYIKRIESLKYLHELGFKTWVSIEPYPTPNIIDQNLIEILEKVSFVDKIIFGKLNYNKNVSRYTDKKNYYNNLSQKVINFCNKNNIDYHIKHGTITE